MAAAKKRRVAEQDDENSSDSFSENSDIGESDNEDLPEEQIEVDFEAQCPDDSDFHGIKQLLLQLFLKAHIDVSQFTDLLIQQNHITSVLKNVAEDDIADEDDDDEGTENFSFGVSSVVNITEKKNMDCIKQLRDYLLEKCQNVCSKEDYCHFKSILENEDQHVGFVLNERLINIPPQISLPLFECLSDDIKAANQQKSKFNFSSYLLIAKVAVDKNKPDDETNLQYVNAEEELFVEDASFKFDFSVAEEQDTGLGGVWTDDDMEWHPKRRVMLFSPDKWENILTKLKTEFSDEASL